MTMRFGKCAVQDRCLPYSIVGLSRQYESSPHAYPSHARHLEQGSSPVSRQRDRHPSRCPKSFVIGGTPPPVPVLEHPSMLSVTDNSCPASTWSRAYVQALSTC